MGGHLALTGQCHLSLPPLGGWTPMGRHLALTGQCLLSLPSLGAWTPMEGHLALTGQCRLSLSQYGTFGIDWSMPFVPATFRSLDTYGGTFGLSLHFTQSPLFSTFNSF